MYVNIRMWNNTLDRTLSNMLDENTSTLMTTEAFGQNVGRLFAEFNLVTDNLPK